MIPTQSNGRARAGFSLIEVVVAMTLLSVVIGALGILATRTSERARRADIIAKRNYVVVQQINRYSAVPFDTLRYRINNDLLSTKDTVYGDTISGAVKYFVRRDTVTYVGATATPTAADTFVVEAKIVIIPHTNNEKDTIYKDSVSVRRRNPHYVSKLNY